MRLFPHRPALPRLSLALQGGGAHGAYTWGVLDALLESGGIALTAVSGASAGAMNAVVLADGLARGGPDAAREALAGFWQGVAAQVPAEGFVHVDAQAPSLAPAARLMLQWTQWLSPYQFNPLRLNPLRDLLLDRVDFERLRQASPLALFIAATRANSGRLRLFRERELTVDMLLASACLPTLHHAVEIDGEPYWDGGYSANPALSPLVFEAGARDILIVMLSPLEHAGTPRSAEQIRSRAVEIAFNAAFLREASLLGQAQALSRSEGGLRRWLGDRWGDRWGDRLGGGLVGGRLERRLRQVRFHLIDAQDALAHLPTETKLAAHLPFLEQLRDLGRERTLAWLRQPGPPVGQRDGIGLYDLLG